MTASSWLRTSVPRCEAPRAIKVRHRLPVPFDPPVNKKLLTLSHSNNRHLGRRPSSPLPVDSKEQLLRFGKSTLCT